MKKNEYYPIIKIPGKNINILDKFISKTKKVNNVSISIAKSISLIDLLENNLYLNPNDKLRLQNHFEKPFKYPKEIKHTVNNKKGYSENIFYEHLTNFFHDKIKKNIYLFNENIELEKQYKPDFVFIDDNIKIDIEIDEPYTLENKEPIHYYDELTQKHIDYDRDNFFLENKWIVIRFAERQIINYPETCVKLISIVIEAITNKQKYLNNNEIDENCKIPAIKVWTKDKAKELSKINYREKYIYDDKFKFYKFNYLKENVIMSIIKKDIENNLIIGINLLNNKFEIYNLKEISNIEKIDYPYISILKKGRLCPNEMSLIEICVEEKADYITCKKMFDRLKSIEKIEFNDDTILFLLEIIKKSHFIASIEIQDQFFGCKVYKSVSVSDFINNNEILIYNFNTEKYEVIKRKEIISISILKYTTANNLYSQ